MAEGSPASVGRYASPALIVRSPAAGGGAPRMDQTPVAFRNQMIMWKTPTIVAAALMLCGAVTTAGAADQPNRPMQPQESNPSYHVVDGYKVDANTMNGFRAWRAAGCDRCHGANQEGLLGPSLLESMKTITKADFVKTVRDGRLDKGMVRFSSSKIVMENIDNLYAYLKGRSNGEITRPKVEELKE